MRPLPLLVVVLLSNGWGPAGHADSSGAAPPWGAEGHEMAARAAAETLPEALPEFFRDAGDQLAYLNPEPDRWRERSLVEMAEAWSYGHYIDLERVPEGALEEPHRYAFLRALWEAGFERPEQEVGLLPFRIVELYQRLVTEWRLWHAAPDTDTRAWIEERIVSDAGILGHYVTDASNPHHTTIHFNGWDAETPNPEEYTVDREFHARFEARFVRAHVEYSDVRTRMPAEALSVAGDVRSAVMDYIRSAHEQVEELYRLDRDVGFRPDRPADPDALAFAADRLAAGAHMLRVLWWSAWLEGNGPPA